MSDSFIRARGYGARSVLSRSLLPLRKQKAKVTAKCISKIADICEV